MNFSLPQFTETETKVVGPLTLKQFMYVGGGAGLSFAIYFANPLGTTISIVLIVLIMAAATAMAFVKINGIALPTYLTNALRFAMSSKMFLWENNASSKTTVVPIQGEVKIQKSPTAKKIELKKAGQINQTKKILEIKK